jgi:hypothetical protein
MFNLSDKELDRLSREAASAYDPGEPAGAGSWDMLKLNLDKELGKAGPNPLHAIRRIPFYYAPVIVLLAGVSYYFIRHGKNNSRAAPTPASPVNPQPFTQNNSNKPNSTPYNEHTTDKTGPGATAANTPAPANTGANTGVNTSPGAGVPANPGAPASAGNPANAGNPAGANTPSTSGAPTNTGVPASVGNPSTAGAPSRTVPGSHSGTAPGAAIAPGALNAHSRTRPGSHAGTIPGSPTSGSASPGIAATTNGKAHRPGRIHPSATHQAGQPGFAGQLVQQSTTTHPGQSQPGQQISAAQSGQPGQTGQDQPADLALSVVRKPYSLGKAPAINDSALRKLTAKTAVNNAALINVGKKNNQSLHVDRSLQLGFNIAPDFASVHSLAGDKPGSVTGITLDYEFVNRWYIGTGLLYSRRNYTARSEDYHVPPYYYQMNNMHDVNYIRGSFHMLEIPINLRYDFSLAGNTVFFASAGVSSYLHSNESCSYYYSFFGREAYRKFSYPVQHAPIFSVINLSMGVEAGISNSFSFLVAPYMKLPTNTIGFGKIDMNSIGVNFGVKYSPVLRRTRK